MPGAPAPQDFSVEEYARITAELATSVGADVVVGFSMGATVAYEMVVSGAFAGPVVLLGVSLSAADEPGFFRAIIRLGSILGTLPCAVLKKGAASMVKHAAIPPERQAQLRADFARNNTRDMRRGLQAYLRWLHRDDDPARRLCEAGAPSVGGARREGRWRADPARAGGTRGVSLCPGRDRAGTASSSSPTRCLGASRN